MTELTLDQLRQKIGAGRQRRGLFTLADDEGRPTTDLTISGQPVLVVNLWSDGMARFYADISGSRLLANFNRPSYQVDDPLVVPQSRDLAADVPTPTTDIPVP